MSFILCVRFAQETLNDVHIILKYLCSMCEVLTKKVVAKFINQKLMLMSRL